MNWESILTEIILSIAGIVFTALGGLVSYWISKKIKDDKLKTIMTSLNEVIKNAVLETYQTYVEELKDKNMFDEKAQKKALERCLTIIKTNMPLEVKNWLEANYDDITAYLKGLIEAQIALLKK